MKNYSKNILRFLLILSVFMITYYCYANSFNTQEQMMNEQKSQQEYAQKLQQIRDNTFEELKTCNRKDFGFIKVLGVENGNCKFKTLNLVPTESGFKKYVEYCSMSKKIYFSFIDDIQNLDENSFNKKWNSLLNKQYCQTRIDDKW